MQTTLLFALVFTGGFSVMAIELLGGRILAPYFGSSIYVWGSLITVFMLALSIGYLLGGRLSLHGPNLRRLGAIFVLSALTVLPLLLAGDAIMEAVFAAVDDPRYGSLLASVSLFLVPTVALGMVSPYAVRLQVRHRDHSGQVAGQLYFVSTIGSAAGTLATSFYLVLWLEVWQILSAVLAVLVLCGATAIVAASAPPS